MKDEEKIYGLIAHAEEIQQHTVHLHEEAKKAIEDIRLFTDEIRKDAKQAVKPILQAGLVQAVYIGSTAIIVSLLVSVALIKGLGWHVNIKKLELTELKNKILIEETTLSSIKKKTWSLELVEYNDGIRGIILPRGVKFNQAASVQDGRDVILIRP